MDTLPVADPVFTIREIDRCLKAWVIPVLESLQTHSDYEKFLIIAKTFDKNIKAQLAAVYSDKIKHPWKNA